MTRAKHVLSQVEGAQRAPSSEKQDIFFLCVLEASVVRKF